MLAVSEMYIELVNICHKNFTFSTICFQTYQLQQIGKFNYVNSYLIQKGLEALDKMTYHLTTVELLKMFLLSFCATYNYWHSVVKLEDPVVNADVVSFDQVTNAWKEFQHHLQKFGFKLLTLAAKEVSSVTRCLECLSIFGHIQQYKLAQKHTEGTKVGSKFLNAQKVAKYF